jgi:hypothetical protein
MRECCALRSSLLGVVCVARVLRRGGRHDQERGRRSRAVMVEHVPRTERNGHRGGELPGLQEARVLHLVLCRVHFNECSQDTGACCFAFVAVHPLFIVFNLCPSAIACV